MNSTTTVGFQTIKNKALGRLSQCESLDSFKLQLQLECDKIPVALPSRKEQQALIGIDITEGIDRANQVIDGSIDDL